MPQSEQLLSCCTVQDQVVQRQLQSVAPPVVATHLCYVSRGMDDLVGPVTCTTGQHSFSKSTVTGVQWVMRINIGSHDITALVLCGLAQ